jgi:STE24 endopeptidase
MTTRQWAWITLGVLVVAAAVLVTVAVPWRQPAVPRADQLAALADLPTDRVAQAREFRGELRLISYPSMVVGLIFALLLGLTPLGARIVNAVPGPWLVRALGGGLLILLLADLVTLPFAAWAHAVRVHWGLSTQDWNGWAVDVLKGYLVAMVLAAVALVGFFGLTRLAPNWWWAFGAVGAAALVVLLSFVFPVLVEPVFNKFTPMPAGQLRTELMAMAHRDQVPVKDVLVADASRRTTAVNAYVSGIGPTRRIVVYDTLLAQATPAEVTSVVAHELGHARDSDMALGTALGALGAAAGVVALYLLGGWGWLLQRAGVHSLTDPAAIGLLLAVLAVVGLLAGPAQAMVSRRIESRADEHALELTRDPATFEAMQRRLGLVNLGDPDPPRWEHFLFGSHPSTVQRIAHARAWARR